MMQMSTLDELLPLVKCAELLAQKYDVVVTNPPYMAVSNAGAKVNDYVKKNFPDSKADLFAVFIERCGQMAKQNGYQAMITQHSWMFLSSFEKLRTKLLAVDIVNMAHLGARAFEEIGGEVVQTTAFVMQNYHTKGYKGVYARLIEPTTQQGKEEMFLAETNRYTAQQDNFSKIPGAPVAYWATQMIYDAFSIGTLLNNIAQPKQGMVTRDNNRFIRLWWEPWFTKIEFVAYSHKDSLKSPKRWYPITAGGAFRKWYGNNESVVNFQNDGKEIISFSGPHIKNRDFYFKESITWSAISSSILSMRYAPKGFLPEHAGNCLYCSSDMLCILQALGNSCVGIYLMTFLSPTLNFNVGDIANMPVLVNSDQNIVIEIVEKLRLTSKLDWDSFETSWDFKKHPMI